MTPAANPKRASIRVLFTFLKKKTILAPKAVILQVKRQARNACKTGDKLLNASNIITPLVVGYAKCVNSSGLKIKSKILFTVYNIMNTNLIYMEVIMKKRYR